MEEALNLEEGVNIKVKALANEEGVTKFRGGRYLGGRPAKLEGRLAWAHNLTTKKI